MMKGTAGKLEEGLIESFEFHIVLVRTRTDVTTMVWNVGMVFSLSDQFIESHGSIQGTEASSSICPICQQTGEETSELGLGSPWGDALHFSPW